MFWIVTIPFGLYLLFQSLSDWETKEVYVLPGILFQVIYAVLTILFLGKNHPAFLIPYLGISALCFLGGLLKIYGTGDGRLYQTMLSYCFLGFPTIALLFFFELLLIGHGIAMQIGIVECIRKKEKIKNIVIPMFPAITIAWIFMVGKEMITR